MQNSHLTNHITPLQVFLKNGIAEQNWSEFDQI